MADIPELYRAVARLALPAADQIAYLRFIGVSDLADELALDLDHALHSTAAAHLHPDDRAILQRIDAKLTEMSGPDKDPLWRAEGLRNDPRWAEVRELAKEFIFSQRGHEPLAG